MAALCGRAEELRLSLKFETATDEVLKKKSDMETIPHPRRGSVAHALLSLLLLGCHIQFRPYTDQAGYPEPYEGSGAMFLLRALGWPVRVYSENDQGICKHDYWLDESVVPEETQFREIPLIVIGDLAT